MTDQQTPLDFYGKYDEYIEWSEENAQKSSQWCARHWAPCPVEGLNGVMATITLIQKTFEMMPEEITTMTDAGAQAEAANAWMLSQEEPICCQLGDDEMTRLWLDVNVKMQEALRNVENG